MFYYKRIYIYAWNKIKLSLLQYLFPVTRTSLSLQRKIMPFILISSHNAKHSLSYLLFSFFEGSIPSLGYELCVTKG